VRFILTKTDFLIAPVKPGFVAQNNMHDKMFRESPAYHLASEPPQNTADASNATGGLRGRLTYIFKTIAREALEPYGLATIEAHSEACTEATIGGLIEGETIRVLNYEDESGGLDGNITPTSNDHRSPIGRFMFAMGTGVDGKSDKANGRHGMGSHCGSAASQNRSMFFHTTRRDMSTAASARLSLPTHEIDGTQYAVDARLARITEDGDYDGIPCGPEADTIHAALEFNRPISSPGLSCSVINPDPAVTFHSLVEHLLCNQFYQVSKGIIEFVVADVDTGDTVTISAETLDDLIASGYFSTLKDVVRNRRGRRHAYDPLDRAVDAIPFVKSEPAAESLPVLETIETTAIPAEDRNRWLSGKAVGYLIPQSAEHDTKGTVSGHLKVWMRKLPDGQNGYVINVRDAIVNIRKATGIAAICVASGDDIAVLLGDAEDPPHIKYTAQQARARGWSDPGSVIETFLGAARQLHQALAASESRDDRVSLARFFPMPGKDLAGSSAGGAETEDGNPGDVIVDGEERNNPILVFAKEKQGSVMVLVGKLTPEARRECLAGVLSAISLEVEYQHSKNRDGSFAESGGYISASGYSAMSKMEEKPNAIMLHGVKPDLRVEIFNADRHRDLDITYANIGDDADDELNDLEDAA
jgi:hypothetical protein